MTSITRLAALCALLLVACDGDGEPMTDAGPMEEMDAGPMTGNDAGPGTDAGPPIMPDMAAATRINAAAMRNAAATCACDMGFLPTAEACETFSIGPAEGDQCAVDAFTTHFDTVGRFFTCIADAQEARADCLEAVSGCDMTAIGACNMTAQSAIDRCPTVPMADGQAYQMTLDTCIGTNVVGGAGMCPDDMGPVMTTGDAVFMGSTVGAGNDLDAPDGCITFEGGGGSADRAFRWTAPAAGDFTFDTIGSTFDTVIYVLNSCADTTSLGCNDDVEMENLNSSVTATLTMGQEVLVVVEGFATANAGDFVININPAM